MRMADSLCCTTETNSVLSSNYTPVKIYLKKKQKDYMGPAKTKIFTIHPFTERVRQPDFQGILFKMQYAHLTYQILSQNLYPLYG